jgi:hypothetical protein
MKFILNIVLAIKLRLFVCLLFIIIIIIILEFEFDFIKASSSLYFFFEKEFMKVSRYKFVTRESVIADRFLEEWCLPATT